MAKGGVLAVLDVLPAEEMGFLAKNRPGITMMFGVIIASGIVKFLRFVRVRRITPFEMTSHDIT